MTWHTHTGDRYLKRAEARLFRAATRDVLDHMDADTSDFSGTLLANHSHESLLRLFTYVGIHLLRPTEHMPPLNAWSEGAVGVVFRRITGKVLFEIRCAAQLAKSDTLVAHRWRNLIDSALAEIELAEGTTSAGEKEPGFKLAEEDEYAIGAGILEDQILWNDDWETEDDFSPEPLKEALAILLDYVDSSQTTETSTQNAVQALGSLCGFHRGDFEGIEVP